MYVFGGEFTSPSQMQFYHHKDMWRLDLMTMKWEELSMKGGPTPRSGHRAVAYKGSKIFVFGGFYDTGHDVRYFNDCYMYDTQVCCPSAAHLHWPDFVCECLLLRGQGLGRVVT